jgi:hypothetical protein
VNVVGHGMACMPASNYGGVWVTLITLTRLVSGASHNSVLDSTGTHPHAPAPEPPEHAAEDDASSSSDSSSDSDSSDSGSSSSSLTESSSSSSEVDDAVRENAIFKHVTQSSALPLGDVSRQNFVFQMDSGTLVRRSLSVWRARRWDQWRAGGGSPRGTTCGLRKQLLACAAHLFHVTWMMSPCYQDCWATSQHHSL